MYRRQVEAPRAQRSRQNLGGEGDAELARLFPGVGRRCGGDDLRGVVDSSYGILRGGGGARAESGARREQQRLGGEMKRLSGGALWDRDAATQNRALN